MYKKPENAQDLSRAIAELELTAAAQKKEIDNTFVVVTENLKPANLVKSGVRSVLSGTHNDELVNILIGLGTGFISRKLLLGKPHGFVGKTVGKALQWGMAGLVSKNAEGIKEKAGMVIDWIFRKNKSGSNHIPPPVAKSK
ncbi:MAG TPA: hypothetical protein VII28_10280 [Puia sp.]